MIDVNWDPSRREMKVFSALFVLFFGIVAYSLYASTESMLTAGVVFGVGAVIGVTGFFLPDAMRYVYVGWMIAVFPIGWVVSHLILAVIFYLVVTPIGLLVRLCGHDAMQRKFDRDAESYWIPRGEQPKPEQYFRQF